MIKILPLLRFLILFDLLLVFATNLLFKFLWPTINGELAKMVGYRLPWMAIFLVIILIFLSTAGFLVALDIKNYLNQQLVKSRLFATVGLLVPALVLGVVFYQIFLESRSMLFMKPELNYVLPDLLKMENGTPITDSKSWEQNPHLERQSSSEEPQSTSSHWQSE